MELVCGRGRGLEEPTTQVRVKKARVKEGRKTDSNLSGSAIPPNWAFTCKLALRGARLFTFFSRIAVGRAGFLNWAADAANPTLVHTSVAQLGLSVRPSLLQYTAAILRHPVHCRQPEWLSFRAARSAIVCHDDFLELVHESTVGVHMLNGRFGRVAGKSKWADGLEGWRGVQH